MNIGAIDENEERFLEQYKKLGFRTKTEMVNEALRLMRETREKELRRIKILTAGKRYNHTNQWESLENEDFTLED